MFTNYTLGLSQGHIVATEVVISIQLALTDLVDDTANIKLTFTALNENRLSP